MTLNEVLRAKGAQLVRLSFGAFQHGGQRSTAFGKEPRHLRIYPADFAPDSSPISKQTRFPKDAHPLAPLLSSSWAYRGAIWEIGLDLVVPLCQVQP